MSQPGGASRDRSWVVAVVAVCVAVVSAAVVVLVFKGARSSPGVGSVGSVTLEAAAVAGADPFTPSVASGVAVALKGAVIVEGAAVRRSLPSDASTHTRLASGTAPGLYGGSGDVHVCDPQQLVAFLNTHQDKAAAWARVLGIAPGDIGRYVATLTPVVLTGDTLVGNHGFRAGAPTSLLSVLQAGTAVMVDATGTPRVKCNCGNPLTSPELINLASAHIRGVAWPGYTAAGVTAVRPGKATGTLRVVNITTGAIYDQPVATPASGSGPGVWAATETDPTNAPGQTRIVTSGDGRVWSPAGVIASTNVMALGWGNGVWIAALAKDGSRGLLKPGTDLLESTDLKTWTGVATLPDTVAGLAYGNGRWVAVGNEGPDAGTGVVDGSTDGAHWAPVATIRGTDFEFGLSSVAYGGGQWIVASSGLGARSGTPGGPPVPGVLRVFTSTDGVRWPAAGVRIDAASNGRNGRIGYGAGHWVVTALAYDPALAGALDPVRTVVDISGDGRSWAARPVTGVGEGLLVAASAYGNGKWLAAAEIGPGIQRPSTLLVSNDAATWSPVAHVEQTVEVLAFGGLPVAGAPAPSTPVPSVSPSGTPATSGSAGPLRIVTVTTPDGRHYQVSVLAQDTVADCATNAYGSAVISFLKQHPCAQGATRLLFSVPVGGRTVALSVIIVEFAGTPADPYVYSTQFNRLENESGSGSINDLLRAGTRLPGWPTSIPAAEAFQVPGQDNGLWIFDAWYLTGPTTPQAPELIDLEIQLFLQPLTGH
jgi:hypothetical protein